MVGHPDLVLWMKFEGDAVNLAGTGNGSPNGSPSYEAETFGRGVVIDSSTKFVTIGDDSTADLGTSDFTIVTNCKTSSANNMFMYSKELVGSGANYWIQWFTGKIYLNVTVDTATDRLAQGTTGAYNDGAFHNIITTCKRATKEIVIYVDGVSVALDSPSVNLGTITGSIDNAGFVYIGKRSNGTLPFIGTVGDTFILKGIAVSASHAKAISKGFHPLSRS